MVRFELENGMDRKRIAVLVGQADEEYQKRFISGFLEQAFEFDFDACVFSMYRKYQDNEERERGEANIFSLMNLELFDGVVFLKDTIQTTGITSALEERIHNEFTGPVLVIERESDYFPSVQTDGYSAMAAVVNHLIEVHGYKDIAFLNGKRWHQHSQIRLSAFMDEMKKHNLPVREDHIIYGDFWYKSGEECADILLRANRLPEAVVCANDAMAIGLCDALTSRGLRVPEDIAVTGYDATEEAISSPKAVTSAEIPTRECGAYTARYMKAQFEGKEIEPFFADPHIFMGETCGCCRRDIPELSGKRPVWKTDISESGYGAVSNMMPEDLMAQTGLLEYINVVHTYAYQIPDAETLTLCVSAPWLDMGKDINLFLRNNGYPDTMLRAVRYNKDRRDTYAGLDDSFETKIMLPDIFEHHDDPTAYFFTPVFSENACFGYSVVTYGTAARSYDIVYRQWIMTVNRGFESLRRRVMVDMLSEQLDKVRTGKFSAVTSAYESLTPEEKGEYDLVTHILDENLLTYKFQPIVKTTDGEIYSYEALMRSKTEKRISPLDIIKYASMQGRLMDVERATFMNVLNILDEEKEKFEGVKVFINSIPGVKLPDSYYESISEKLAKNAESIVVELTEEAELKDAELDKLKQFYNDLNIEIAVDDYGAGYSNVNNLIRYMPNYVKIDRALLSDIPNRPQKRYFVREIIEFCHDNGILALAEGVETVEELRVVIHLGADLIQGYYTAKPSAEIVKGIDEKVKEEIITFRRERDTGNMQYIYEAGRTNRVSLGTLAKEGYTEILVGKDTPVYKDITLIGVPQVPSRIPVEIASDYTGIITLENVDFSAVKKRPCISVGENCNVIISLIGENSINRHGIMVPESSEVSYEGEGTLSYGEDVIYSPEE